MNAERDIGWVLVVLALTVIVFGAYVRLSDAGLGCPDWPGCYGRLLVPATEAPVHLENPNWSYRPLEQGKAWREMVHRYLASTLGLGIIVLALVVFRKGRAETRPAAERAIVYLLVPLVVFQGLLGMWTVTLLLKPLVVSAHLLGGLSTLALLWWHLLNRLRGPVSEPRAESATAKWGAIGLGLLVFQIFLGGWTSTNYAALACIDFPTCHGQWWPQMDFAEAFVLWRGLGVNYEFGVLETPARTAIHYSHRLGAAVTALVLAAIAIGALRAAAAPLARSAWCILAALTVQIGLGITNVLGGLPLAVAVAHNAVAALLLMSVLALLHAARRYV
jgi:cytochrome c oxidase assembly protein subunit 15